MERRDFFKGAGLLAGTTSFKTLSSITVLAEKNQKKFDERTLWVEQLVKLATPVLENMAGGTLRKNMPVEASAGQEADRAKYTHLEAVGRTLAGMAPWLALQEDTTEEGKWRKLMLDLAQKSLIEAVNPSSPDFLNFEKGQQPVVDAAFLAHAILRAPDVLYHSLPSEAKKNLIAAFKATRKIKPYFNNWLLFSAMIEAFFLLIDEPADLMRLDYAIKQHEQWYKGDGVYGDGPDFHADYYNSFVIQPMLLDIMEILVKKNPEYADSLKKVLRRATRYAAIQERMIAPDGTFPIIGRSLCYRFGCFQHLSQMALQGRLPEELAPGQVRRALTAVLQKTMQNPDNYTTTGWLRLGLYGSQPGLAEVYISTGSLYLASTGFLALGLSPTHEFWTSPSMPFTSQRVWKGENVGADKALKD